MISLPSYMLAMLLFSAASFLFFGIACLTTSQMVSEFKRYGLSKYRVLTGCLQIAGAISLLAGLFYLPFALIGSIGLAILMLLGLIVRIRIKDGILKSLPAFLYSLLNFYIFFFLNGNYV